MEPFIAIAGLVVFLGGVIVLIIFLVRRNNQAPKSSNVLQDLATRYKGTVARQGWLEFSFQRYVAKAQHITGKHANYTLTIELAGGEWPARFTPPDEGLWGEPLRSPLNPVVRFSKEQVGQRFGKQLGINREVQIGDAAFDAAIYIDTDAPDELVHQICQRPEAREAIMALLNAGFPSVEVFGIHAPVAVISKAPPPHTTSAAAQDVILNHLGALVSSLPPIEIERPGKVAVGWPSGLALTTWALAFVSTIANAVTGEAIDTFGWDMFQASMKLSALLLPPLLGVVFVFIRGRSSSFAVQVGLMLGLMALVPSASITGIRLWNTYGDTSPGHVVPAKVLKTWTTSGKSSTYYHVELDPKGNTLPITEVEVSFGLYNCLSQGEITQLTVRDGALDIPWIENLPCSKPR